MNPRRRAETVARTAEIRKIMDDMDKPEPTASTQKDEEVITI
jgi:hypothetical protein